MASDDNPTAITLKRNVSIKAIVTERFKKFLVLELNNNIAVMDERIKTIEKAEKAPGVSTEYFAQLSNEKKQIQVQMEDFQNKINEAQGLKLETLFNQGTIEGFANIKVGDDLYQKLGAMEVIVKDGVVNDIKIIPQQPL
ncbi:hypothetical protein HOH87_01565 [bacterium]|jgi:hypothetical protein|nr:hypothetical protein [bacterium]